MCGAHTKSTPANNSGSTLSGLAHNSTLLHRRATTASATGGHNLKKNLYVSHTYEFGILVKPINMRLGVA